MKISLGDAKANKGRDFKDEYTRRLNPEILILKTVAISIPLPKTGARIYPDNA